MRPTAILFVISAVAGSAALSWLAGDRGAIALETALSERIDATLAAEEITWIKARTNGLRVTLVGAAPNEAARFEAIELVSSVVPANRLTDRTTLISDPVQKAPEFQLQVLRTKDTATLLGLVPDTSATRRFRDRIEAISPGGVRETLLETVREVPPSGWEATLQLALTSITALDQARIDLRPGSVTVTGVARSAEDVEAVRAALEEATPEGVALSMDLSAPLPVRTPYGFRATRMPLQTLVTECAADTAEAQDTIRTALERSDGASECPLALGAPTPEWSAAVTAGLEGLRELDYGLLEIVNTDLTLTSAIGEDPETLARAGEIITEALPAPYTLSTVLREEEEVVAAQTDVAPMVFTAVRTEDGAVRIRGDLRDQGMQRTTESFAKAQFGFDAVVDETALREDLPPLWYNRVLVGLEALSMLTTGNVEVTPDLVTVTGEVTSEMVREEIRRTLSRKLPPPSRTTLDLFVNPVVPEPKVSEVRAEFCATQIDLILSRAQILFPPGETEISDDSIPVIDGIVQVLADCPGSRFEIEGHTDSQGRESSNLAISNARAAAVLNALLERGINQVFLTAQGYGESLPIATNETEEGRALNRRIAFRLISEQDAEDLDNAEEAVPEEAASEGSEPAGEAPEPETAGEEAAPEDAPETDERSDSSGEEPPAEASAEAAEDVAPEDVNEAAAVAADEVTEAEAMEEAAEVPAETSETEQQETAETQETDASATPEVDGAAAEDVAEPDEPVSPAAEEVAEDVATNADEDSTSAASEEPAVEGAAASETPVETAEEPGTERPAALPAAAESDVTEEASTDAASDGEAEAPATDTAEAAPEAETPPVTEAVVTAPEAEALPEGAEPVEAAATNDAAPTTGEAEDIPRPILRTETEAPEVSTRALSSPSDVEVEVEADPELAPSELAIETSPRPLAREGANLDN